MGKLKRETGETRVVLEVRRGAGRARAAGNLAAAEAAKGKLGRGELGKGKLAARDAAEGEIATGDAFLDHMLVTLARYAGLDLTVQAEGDLRHHLVEDVAIVLGMGIADEVPEACARYGWASVPMDDALVRASIDIGGRAWYEGRLPSRLYEHFLQSLAVNLGATLHVETMRGRDRHHVVEAAMKATGLALRQALVEGGKGGDGVFSTKGAVNVERLDA